MNPSIIIALMLVAGTGGGLLYSYHIGKAQGETICEANVLRAKLEQKEEELKITDQLAQYQQEQLSEAQNQLTKETEANAKLKEELDKALSAKPLGCITPGMRDAIKEYRAKTRNKNS